MLITYDYTINPSAHDKSTLALPNASTNQLRVCKQSAVTAAAASAASVATAAATATATARTVAATERVHTHS